MCPPDWVTIRTPQHAAIADMIKADRSPERHFRQVVRTFTLAETELTEIVWRQRD